MEKEKTSCGSEGNLFASEWAIEYRSTVERQTSNAQLIREKIAASGLSGERQAELVDAVEAKLWVRLSGGFAYYGLRSPNLCLLLSSSLLLLPSTSSSSPLLLLLLLLLLLQLYNIRSGLYKAATRWRLRS